MVPVAECANGVLTETVNESLPAAGAAHVALKWALAQARFPTAVFKDFRHRQNYARNAAQHREDLVGMHEDRYFAPIPARPRRPCSSAPCTTGSSCAYLSPISAGSFPGS